MKYRLNDGVVVAYGATNSCIYDLRETTAKIYTLDKKASNFLLQLTTQVNVNISDDGKLLISKLIDNSLVIQTDSDFTTRQFLNLEKNKRSVWIELTEKCQLKCIYCYGSFDSKKNNTLSIDKLDLLIAQLIENDFRIIKIIGGEPLLYKVLVQSLVEKLSIVKDVYIELYTNGLLITEEFLSFCFTHKVKLAIGIFGANETECKNVTGIDAVFLKQKNIIELVKKSGVDYRFSITRTEMNDSVSKNELANIYMFPVSLLRQDQVKNVGRAISRSHIETIETKQIKQKYFSGKFASSFIYANIVGGHSCFKNKICITATLDVYPCIMERSIVYGNILENPLSEILKVGEPYISASKDTVDTCKYCEYRYACFDCRVNRQSASRFFSKPSNCGYNPHTGIWVD